ncbi:Uma2 family endonuclease [Calothrix sp. UHCC 0171]|uniref:Uma2 family endonuclease n=1 Tax=Calothrix sp. UHCC 0171 TaxID=3110245 RepID=UPI002B21AF4B|nr:Uma2 family endonuclease [Calothrix sp. UHCC 0171]MEA5574284.1 Uma2 family endonuclease [Calothrix sp. UHCC 0171]
MVQSPNKRLTLEEFLALPEGDVTYEFVNGAAVPKYKTEEISPKFFHSRFQKTLLILLDRCLQNQGRVEVEWAIKLKIENENWMPVPDLTYVSYKLLPADWLKDEPCPVSPELVVEIISPGQTFGEMTEKATDYIKAGVLRVWVVDTKARTITIFAPACVPATYRENRLISDDLLPGLEITPDEVFQRAGLIA